jgi:hypothetical protein
MAVYSTIAASDYGLKKDDMQIQSLTHLVKSNDWLNDYEEQKLGEIILQSQIDNMNITLQNNMLSTIKPIIICINTSHILILCMLINQLKVH